MKPAYTDEDLKRAREAWRNWHHDNDGLSMPQVIARLIAEERERCAQREYLESMASFAARCGS